MQNDPRRCKIEVRKFLSISYDVLELWRKNPNGEDSVPPPPPGSDRVKTKMVRGNNAPSMNKELSKEVMVRSKFRNKFNRHKAKTNWKDYTKQRNKCTHLRREAVRLHFSKLCKNGVISDESFGLLLNHS